MKFWSCTEFWMLSKWLTFQADSVHCSSYQYNTASDRDKTPPILPGGKKSRSTPAFKLYCHLMQRVWNPTEYFVEMNQEL